VNGPGQIITFYSYKGGVGRSMAVANVGTLLARGSQPDRVLLVDWDLDAPGLIEFFREKTRGRSSGEGGLLEYFQEVRRTLHRRKSLYQELVESAEALDDAVPLKSYVRRDVLPGLDLLAAAAAGADCRRMVAEFDWAVMWEKYPAVFRAFQELLEERYRFALIDSRTGYNDTAGICTAIMPQKLVAVFTLNQQNLDGVIDVVERSVKYRSISDDVRPLAVFPLASRVENSELKQQEVWLRRAEERFEKCFARIYKARKCRLGDYFQDVLIPYIPYFAYGEKLVLLTEESRAGSMRRAYEVFASRLTELDYSWQRRDRADWPVVPA